MSLAKALVLTTIFFVGCNSLLANTMLLMQDQEKLKHEAAKYALQFLQSTKYKAQCADIGTYDGNDKESLIGHYKCIEGAQSVIVDKVYMLDINNGIEPFISSIHDLPLKSDPSRKTNFPDEYEVFMKNLEKLNVMYEEMMPANASMPKVAVNSLNTGSNNNVQSSSTETQSKGNKDSKLPLISLIVSLLALLAGLFSYLMNGKGIKSLEQKLKDVDTRNMTERSMAQEAITRDQKGFVSKKEVEAVVSERVNEELNRMIAKLKVTEQQQARPVASAGAAQNPSSNQSQMTAASSKPREKRQYARFSEGGNCFDENILKDEPERVSVFVLELKDNGTGEYYINKESNAQQVALSDFEGLLGSCCIFRQYPNASTKAVITVRKGQLKKQGDKWMIISKAEISLS